MISRSEAKPIDIAYLKSIAAEAQRIGLAAENLPPIGCDAQSRRGSFPLHPPANTDTRSDVSGAVSQARNQFATNAATDRRSRVTQISFDSKSNREGGRGVVVLAGPQRRESVFSRRKFSGIGAFPSVCCNDREKGAEQPTGVTMPPSMSFQRRRSYRSAKPKK